MFPGLLAPMIGPGTDGTSRPRPRDPCHGTARPTTGTGPGTRLVAHICAESGGEHVGDGRERGVEGGHRFVGTRCSPQAAADSR